MGMIVAVTGSTLRDIPALRRAAIGIATTPTIESELTPYVDMTLSKDGLASIMNSVKIARMLAATVQSYLCLRLTTGFHIILFSTLSSHLFTPSSYGSGWPPVFILPANIIAVLALMSYISLLALSSGQDKATVTGLTLPVQWKFYSVFPLSLFLSTVNCCFSLLFLAVLLTNLLPVPEGTIHYGEVIVAMFLQLSVSSYVTLLSVRAGDTWFWLSLPAPHILIVGTAVSVMMPCFVASMWPTSNRDGVPLQSIPGLMIAYVLAYNFLIVLPLMVSIAIAVVLSICMYVCVRLSR
jgi:magnesium-transporting ATPase (P-type)